MGDRVSPVVRHVVALVAPPEAREAFLGDLLEEFAARGGRTRIEARLWLAGELFWASVAWARYRLPRSRVIRRECGPWVGASSAWAFFAVLNLPMSIGFLRGLPDPWLVPVAYALNLAAIAFGGLVVAAIGGGTPLGAGLRFAALTLAWPLVGSLTGAGYASLPSPMWLLTIGSVALMATWGFRASGGTGPIPEARQTSTA